jgi:hypothetical protein
MSAGAWCCDLKECGSCEIAIAQIGAEEKPLQ